MVDIPFDVGQPEWGSSKWYADWTLDPWDVDKYCIHYGGGANVAGSLEKARSWVDSWLDSNPDKFIDDCPVEVVFPSVKNEKYMLRRWQNYHINGRGWTDIAYNYGLGQSGKIYRLRGENRSGATSGDYEPDGIPENYEARAVVWIGGAGQQPTEEAYAAFKRIYNADPQPVTVHSDHKSTGCPGDYWRAWVKDEEYLMPEEPEGFEPPSSWAAADWDWADMHGITSKHSDPHKTVTKEELVVMLRRLIDGFYDAD